MKYRILRTSCLVEVTGLGLGLSGLYYYNVTGNSMQVAYSPRASIPMGQGGHVPPIFGLGDIITNVPPIFLE